MTGGSHSESSDRGWYLRADTESFPYMCGIVGIVATNGSVEPPVLQRMNDLLAHRGPDGEGFLFASGWEQLRYSFLRRADGALGGVARPRRARPSASGDSGSV